MNYSIRMGIPEMEELWSSLQAKFRSGTIGKTELQLYKKMGQCLKKAVRRPVLSQPENARDCSAFQTLRDAGVAIIS